MHFLAFFLVFLVLDCEWKVCVRFECVGKLWVCGVDNLDMTSV